MKAMKGLRWEGGCKKAIITPFQLPFLLEVSKGWMHCLCQIQIFLWSCCELEMVGLGLSVVGRTYRNVKKKIMTLPISMCPRPRSWETELRFRVHLRVSPAKMESQAETVESCCQPSTTKPDMMNQLLKRHLLHMYVFLWIQNISSTSEVRISTLTPSSTCTSKHGRMDGQHIIPFLQSGHYFINVQLIPYHYSIVDALGNTDIFPFSNYLNCSMQIGICFPPTVYCTHTKYGGAVGKGGEGQKRPIVKWI